jgi:SPW repeat-containing protein
LGGARAMLGSVSETMKSARRIRTTTERRVKWRLEMRAWTRWQDWATMLLGIVLLATPFIFQTTAETTASWTAYVVGALLVGAGLWLASTEEPDGVVETIPLVLGAALFVAPWALSFTSVTMAAWMAWIVGGLTVINAAGELVVLLAGQQPEPVSG